MSSVADFFNNEVYHSKYQKQKIYRRYFQIAGITVYLESELDLAKIKFNEAINAFAVDGLGEDNVLIRHHFGIPELKDLDFGKELYNHPPWIISVKDEVFCYRGVITGSDGDRLYQLAFFNAEHTRGIIYNPLQGKDRILKEYWHTLSLMTSDQIWLIPLLAQRSAVLLHSSAAILNGQGLIFVGHSDAGKSTTMELLNKASLEKGLSAITLCDDRNVIRRWPDEWHVHGTWCHGDITNVSPLGAPLKAILFLEQTRVNKITLLTDQKLVWRRLLPTMIRSIKTAHWWQQALDILDHIVEEVPCYIMSFDKSGEIVTELEKL